MPVVLINELVTKHVDEWTVLTIIMPGHQLHQNDKKYVYTPPTSCAHAWMYKNSCVICLVPYGCV